MTRVGTLLMVAAIWSATAVPESFAGRGDKPGVFGTINGNKFKATNVEGAGDPCVNGIYEPSTSTLVFGAIECRGKRRRQGVAVKRNYQVLVLACARYPSASLVPPYEIPCPGSGYSETRTGRFGLPRSMATWTANFQFLEDFTITSNLRMRIDAFDGTSVRGVLFGVFDVPAQGASGAAPIEGEVRFNFPVEVR